MKLWLDWWYDRDTASELAELGCRRILNIGSNANAEDEEGLPIVDRVIDFILTRPTDFLPSHFHFDWEADGLMEDIAGRGDDARAERYAKRLGELEQRIREDVSPSAEFSVYVQTPIPLWHGPPGSRVAYSRALEQDESEATKGARFLQALAEQHFGARFVVSLYSWTGNDAHYDGKWRRHLVERTADSPFNVIPAVHHRYVYRGPSSSGVGRKMSLLQFVRDQLAPILDARKSHPANPVEDIFVWTGGDGGEFVRDKEGRRVWSVYPESEQRRRGRELVKFVRFIRRVFPEAR